MRRLSEVLLQQYGEKVYKLSLSSGCTCPNRDGTLGYGGCTFCSEGGSGDFAAACAPIDEQLEEAKARIRARYDLDRLRIVVVGAPGYDRQKAVDLAGKAERVFELETADFTSLFDWLARSCRILSVSDPAMGMPRLPAPSGNVRMLPSSF